MSFLDDIRGDFETILEGEFSSRIVFRLSGGSTVDTFGIFDETYEEIPQQEGMAPVVSQMARVVVYDAPSTLKKDDQATVYLGSEIKEYLVFDVETDSEKNSLIRLIKDP